MKSNCDQHYLNVLIKCFSKVICVCTTKQKLPLLANGGIKQVLKFRYANRDPLSVVLAHERAFGASPICLLMWLTLRLRAWRLSSRVIGYHRCQSIEQVAHRTLGWTMFEVCLVIWSGNHRRYFEQAASFEYHALDYDELIESPDEFCLR